MEVVIGLYLIYLSEFMCYKLGMELLFDQKVKIGKTWIVSAGVVTGISLLPVHVSMKIVLMPVWAILVMYSVMVGTCISDLVKAAGAFVLVTCFEDMIDSIISFFTEYYRDDGNYRIANYLCISVLTYLFFCILLNVQRKMFKRSVVHVQVGVYVCLCCVISIVMSAISMLNVLRIRINDSEFRNFCGIFNIIGYSSIFLFICLIAYIKGSHERMERLLKNERILKELQIYHYHQMLEKEEDTRKYRHDMNNHLIYVNQLFSKNRNKEAATYIKEMQQGLQVISKNRYTTGNELVDAM